MLCDIGLNLASESTLRSAAGTIGLVADLDSLDAFALDARLRRAVSLEQRLEAELGPLLRRVATGQLYRLRGYPDLERYASDRLGISARKCWALLRIERAGRSCPPLLRAARAFFSAPRDVARLFQATLCTVRRRLGARLGRRPR